MIETRSSGAPRRRRTRGFVLVALVAVVVVLALILVPARTQAQELSVPAGSSSSATFSFGGPTYVTMHFASPAGTGMHYWMSGPSGGMMYNHSMMGGGRMGGAPATDSFSFWTWGGQYHCGATSPGGGPGTMPVWVNATSAVL